MNLRTGTNRKRRLEALVLALLLALAGGLVYSGAAGRDGSGRPAAKKLEPQMQLEKGINCKGKGKRALGRVCLA